MINKKVIIQGLKNKGIKNYTFNKWILNHPLAWDKIQGQIKMNKNFGINNLANTLKKEKNIKLNCFGV